MDAGRQGSRAKKRSFPSRIKTPFRTDPDLRTSITLYTNFGCVGMSASGCKLGVRRAWHSLPEIAKSRLYQNANLSACGDRLSSLFLLLSSFARLHACLRARSANWHRLSLPTRSANAFFISPGISLSGVYSAPRQHGRMTIGIRRQVSSGASFSGAGPR